MFTIKSLLSASQLTLQQARRVVHAIASAMGAAVEWVNSLLIGHQQGIGNEKKSWQLVSEATDFRKHDRLVPLLDACGRPNVMLWMQSYMYLLLAYGIGVKELRDRAAGLDDGAAVPGPGFEWTGLRSWIAHSTGGDDLE